jgi:ABC-type sugar transport system permease subunit
MISGQEVAIEWVVDEQYSMFTILFYTVWTGFGGNIVMLTGAIHRIPEDVIEYGKLEGISMTRELFSIVIPLMWPTISMTIVTSFAGIFGATGSILLFTPNLDQTFTFGYWIYDQVRRYQSYYIPSALGLIFTVIAYPLCLLVRKLVTSIWSDVE